MGEEEKKPEEKKVEEKKTEEEKKPEEEAKAEKPYDAKKVEEAAPVIILKVYMHCEGCARKIRRCLKDFPGVEDVETDCKSDKVVVKGEKADPLKVVARLQRKSNRQVELLSPLPAPPPAEEPKAAKVVKEVAKPEEKKEEPHVITVVLKVHMHCEACAQEIKKRIMRMKGVENAEPDLKNSQVTVKGVFDPEKLVEYMYKRTGKQALIVKQEPEKKEDKKGDDKKGGEAAVTEKEKKDGSGGSEEPAKPEATAAAEQADTQVLDMKKNESFYYHPYQNHQIYPQMFAAEAHSATYPPAPQMFSDENPNACSIM